MIRTMSLLGLELEAGSDRFFYGEELNEWFFRCSKEEAISMETVVHDKDYYDLFCMIASFEACWWKRRADKITSSTRSLKELQVVPNIQTEAIRKGQQWYTLFNMLENMRKDHTSGGLSGAVH